MRKSGRLFIVLGVTLALVAAILAVVAFSDGSSKQAQGAEKGTVVVAAHALAANKVLTQDAV
ncbi:MAG: hypothetical protein IRY97_02015, partial [Thermomicrobiaceae bacterium]|nr:hypothetical protein [Thermomicrobiaceae bacterium]